MPAFPEILLASTVVPALTASTIPLAPHPASGPRRDAAPDTQEEYQLLRQQIFQSGKRPYRDLLGSQVVDLDAVETVASLHRWLACIYARRIGERRGRVATTALVPSDKHSRLSER
jgi:hypothetical protein